MLTLMVDFVVVGSGRSNAFLNGLRTAGRSCGDFQACIEQISSLLDKLRLLNVLLLLLEAKLLLLLVLLDAGWRCGSASTKARHLSLGHTVAVGAVEVLVRSDWWGQDACRYLLHVASLLGCLGSHELAVDRSSDLLDVDVGRRLLLSDLLGGLLLGKERLSLKELLHGRCDGGEVGRAVLPHECRRRLGKVVGEGEDHLRVVASSPLRVARLLAAEDATGESDGRPCHDRGAHRDELLVIKSDLGEVPRHVLKLGVT